MSGEAAFPYELTAHAAAVLAERGIPREWVGRVVAAPAITTPDRADPALRHALARIPEHGNRVLRVVYNERTVPWRIVTAFFDRNAGRHL
jgi:hypothetical protein